MMLSAESLSQGYGPVNVLEGVDVQVRTGEVLAVLGPNGCGKSTLIRTLCNALPPRGGCVHVDGRRVGEIPKRELASLIGYVPQNYAEHQDASVLDAVLMGRRPYIEWGYGDADFAIAEDSLRVMGMLDLASSGVRELSGGQMQRVSIARALTQRPRFYLFDEPTSSLDLRHQIDTMKLMRKVVRERDSGMAIALHDLNLALRYSDRVVMLKDGGVYRDGPPEEAITCESIMDVYGVRAQMVETEHGAFMLPFDSVDRSGGTYEMPRP